MNAPAPNDREPLKAGVETEGTRRLERPVQVLKRFLRDTQGATAIEYALIAGLIFLAIISSVQLFATRVNGVYQRIGDAMSSAG